MNFEFARENMIKQQVLPEGIPVGALVDAMASTPREKFLPQEYQSLAYCDTRFIINGREVRSPMLIAKLVNALNVKYDDNVLQLELDCGYTTALLAKISNHVDVLGYDENIMGSVKRALVSQNIQNIDFSMVEHIQSIIDSQKKYDCIYILNPVKADQIDESLLGLLEISGRLVFVVRNDVCDKAYLTTRVDDESYEKNFLFDIYNK
ncbi:protein-L-isoaspartate O-methyltransferase [Allofrancisella guangzhouensis]|uniref:Protein-L-isoaspartate O-methyltransferase n=1 Tax=Allofrancisella guangzhouensis TaxID=594679 RepID=A0A0A8E385_9GAMM|nr:protein-L-isoaspartate O-methyltransferase [Allofrancisella guangzhouensis]AJC48473.1 protein-L-isoaspartate O-methyltransferase [Allofrancisella guangzhouensis]MBK2027624.1 protein-L-isoaspartate O-methyltransferase [Allofrancisella guangzhouensis]MBK2044063.1 protein-L-isoaspartate O-methyltransferase [Allofrancisella guangzhouensis]MBK2046511.1 protein-L-isoaspartate O-methyltransferase [Allofrancisella guangzhouensis]